MVLSDIHPFVIAYLFMVGLMLGSFINLAADRVPRGESLIRPRSHCRNCGRQLNVVDLLPLAGYLLRRGRCATCGTTIGMSSPIIEGVAGAGMLLATALLGLWPGGAVGLALVALWGAVVVASAVRVKRSDA